MFPKNVKSKIIVQLKLGAAIQFTVATWYFECHRRISGYCKSCHL